MMLRLLPLLAAFCSWPAFAGQISISGVTFSEASDNVRLLSAGGTGTLEDPLVIHEEITASGDAIIRIRIDSPDFGSRLGTTHAIGFALRKEVTNLTAHAWDFFALELELEIGKGSDYYDGLSFAQSTTVARPFRSDRFAKVEDVSEPRDMIRFDDGLVEVGDTVSFLVAITHTVPLPEFFLVQNIRSPFVENDRPGRLLARVQDTELVGPLQ